MASSRYVKVSIIPLKINAIGSIVVGQHDDWLLLERPEPKKRSKQDNPRRKRRTKAEMAAAKLETASV